MIFNKGTCVTHRCLFFISRVLHWQIIWSFFFDVFQQKVFSVDFPVGGSEHGDYEISHKHCTFNLAVFCNISEFLLNVFCSLLNLNSIRSVSSSVAWRSSSTSSTWCCSSRHFVFRILFSRWASAAICIRSFCSSRRSSLISAISSTKLFMIS